MGWRPCAKPQRSKEELPFEIERKLKAIASKVKRDKQRNGPTGVVELHFRGATTSFHNRDHHHGG